MAKHGYKQFKGKGFGVQEGETAHTKGRGQDAHVVVVGQDGVTSHLPYGGRSGQFDYQDMSHKQLEKLLTKLHPKEKESRRPILESRRNEDEFDDGTPRPIDLKSIYQKPERTNGWKNSNVYSPAIPKFEKESKVIIREY